DFATSLGHVIPVTKVSTDSGTIQFSWTKAFLPTAAKSAPLPSYNVFLLRGSAISLIHAGKRSNPTMAMLPDIFDPSNSKLNNASLGVKASAVEKLQLHLKDKFGNPVSDISKNAALNADVSISPNVTPVSAFTSLLFPGRTYGTVPNAFAVGDAVNKPGIWESNFTQGSTAATDQGATVSIAIVTGGGDVSPNGQINGLNSIFVPHNLRSNAQINFEVLSSGVSNIKIDMYATQGGATSSSNLVATRTLATSLVTAASSSLPLVPSTNNIKTGGALDTTGNGAKIGDITTKGLGSRAVGNQDTVTVTVASGSTTFTGSVNYSWAK
ncbi:MAG: hypothetical protein FJZ00_06690, partial [Candidatus Sericytochromatia bacterium]|nr:hypothetical protein [Candidatus Tanganyikabacteria bacterium]